MIFRQVQTLHNPGSLAAGLLREPGLVLLDAHWADPSKGPAPRFSFVAARPFLEFRSRGSRCETSLPGSCPTVQYGNPWMLFESLVGRYEMLGAMDVPVPLGGCFGFWGYGLKRFVEPRIVERATCDLQLPDCRVGFYSSYAVFDHVLGAAFVLATGLAADGSCSPARAREEAQFWVRRLESDAEDAKGDDATDEIAAEVGSTFNRASFIRAVEQAQHWIRHGHIYQVNLSQRLHARLGCTPWEFYRALSARARAPYAAYLDCRDFHIASCSPELFLRMSGQAVVTRPIKGSRPTSADTKEDSRLSRELCSNSKERAELVMITDLLRNDLGRFCEYGSIHVPELARLETHPYVKHLVSTVEGRLRPDISHAGALAACFPGGSVTGAPKVRAMEIIEELEPVARGPYTGAIGYLGFNRESQLSIAIRTAVMHEGCAYYGTGAGIVADSDPEAEYEETLVKARIFQEALRERELGDKIALSNQGPLRRDP